jgi:hypothetical protein
MAQERTTLNVDDVDIAERFRAYKRARGLEKNSDALDRLLTAGRQ